MNLATNSLTNSLMRIAIIGAGAAGLSAAHVLTDLGYKNITLYERNHRIGGKVFSLQHAGAIVELGALWAGTSYHYVLDMAKRYGVEFSQESCDLLLWQDRQFKMMQETFFNGDRRLSMPAALVNANVTFLRYRRDISKIGFTMIDPSLSENFASFAKRHHFSVLASAFRPFWLGCGYADFDETPAIYVLKLLAPMIQNSVQTLLATRSWEQMTAGMVWFPTGYSTLFESIAGRLTDVRLGTAVTSVDRVHEQGNWSIKIRADGQVENFDRVIVAVDPKSAWQFLDVSSDEDKLLTEIETHPYRMVLVNARHQNLASNKVILRDDAISSVGRPLVVSAIQRKEFAPWWVVGQLGGVCGDHDVNVSCLVNDLEALGFEAIQVERVAEWNYFPRVSSSSLNSGYFDRFEAQQGQRGTFYVGSLFNSETVEHTVEFASQLIRRYFGSDSTNYLY